ncbi:MAG: peptide chain release factor N(5)-glutamine methyltransferase [Bacteroidota bacterium]
MNILLRTYYENFLKKLSEVYETAEAQSIANIVFEDVLMMKRHHIFMLEKDLTQGDTEMLDGILNKLLKHEPVQYVLGMADFFGLRFKVNKNVLIPRRETEELVDAIVKEVRGWKMEGEKGMNILDICTGSGCIAIAIKKNIPAAHVSAVDISKDALEVATENAMLNKVDVDFYEGDILTSHFPLPTSSFSTFNSPFSIIVSNPPYITQKEKETMHQNVLGYEPHLALFVSNENPLLFYEAIANFAQQHLSPNGKLFVEINESFGNEVAALFAAKGFTKNTIVKDMQGKDRFVCAQF